MKPTEKSLAAMELGSVVQMLNWKYFQDDYAKHRAAMLESLSRLEFPLELPENVEDFVKERDNLTGRISDFLRQDRARLGGDCYALTMYYFGYVPLELIVSAAWKSENYEPLLWVMTGILTDFGIDGEYEAVKRILDVETEWLAQQSDLNGGDIRVEDALKASLRLINRVGSLWKAAEKLDFPVKFDNVPYHSVFISYSGADEEFAIKLYDYLSEAGLRVWFAPHDIRPGQKLHHQIYSAIEQYDKLLLVLSESSIESEWVGTELYKAREREREQKTQMLFPVRLVPFEKVKKWSAFDADSGRDLAREVREYFIPDLSAWRDEAVFGREADRLVEALMVEAPAETELSTNP